MKSEKFKILIFGFWIFFSSCGTGAVEEQIQPADAPPAGEKVSLNLAPSEKIYVAAAFFTDPVGSIATVGINNPYSAQTALAVTDSSDLKLRSFDNKLFVINEGITSTIQVIDPTTLKIIGNYSVEPSSNPHDLVVANGKAFISRYDSNLASNKDDLWIVNPTSGERITTIDLKPYTTNDGDRLARADQMVLVGNFLYVLMGDLSASFVANTNGKVAVIDTRTNGVVTVIQLAGRNPTSIAYQADLNRLFIADTGVYQTGFVVDVNTAYGGIEEVNPDTNTTLGILIDDKDFGGELSSLVLVSKNLGVVTVKAKTVATFNPENTTVLRTSLYTSASGFIPELLVDKNGLLWIPERDPRNDGMVVIDPTNGTKIGGPFPVGALPASMSLIK